MEKIVFLLQRGSIAKRNRINVENINVQARNVLLNTIFWAFAFVAEHLVEHPGFPINNYQVPLPKSNSYIIRS